jgi:glycerate-2-kinase
MFEQPASLVEHGTEHREFLRQLFARALAESSIHKAFARAVGFEGGVLRIRDDLYDLSACDRVLVVSIGKAAHTMVEALAAQVGGRVQGIVAAPCDPAVMVPGFEYFRGGHPVPNADSLRAADAILAGLKSLTSQSLAVFLLSGGGSAVVERPTCNLSLEDIIATYRVLVHSGAPIAEINAIRMHLSAVKGGRMARAAGQARQVSIMISDVPDTALDSLASGPTLPDSSTVEDCYAISARYDLLPLSRYRVPMIDGPYCFVVTSRGCPGGCAFCIKHVSYQSTLRLRSAAKIHAEIRELARLGATAGRTSSRISRPLPPGPRSGCAGKDRRIRLNMALSL